LNQEFPKSFSPAQDDKAFLIGQDDSSFDIDLPVIYSGALIEPGIFGIFRPVLLMPAGILERLSAEQMRAIVAHEMCHVRRRDNLTFALHMVVETLLWFHPAVWWIGARLIEERERACDEAVIEAGGEALVYVEGILNVCKFYVESPIACVAGVTGADLKKRIGRIMTEQVVRKMSLGAKILICGVILLASGLPVAAGLGLASWSLAQSQSDEVVPNPPKFEVASIKPSRPDDQNDNWNGHGGALSIENYTLRRLIRMAYGLKSDSQVVGGPGWLDHQAFDIEAKLDETEAAKLRDMTGPARFREYCFAVQSLIADRFRLMVHRDSQDRPIYALVVARGGAKLANAAPMLDADGKPKAERDHSIYVSNGHMTATGISMSALADFLTGAGSDRVVLDRTELTGDYDFHLDWTEDNGKAAAADAQYPSLFTALQEQLGLKLEPTKGPVRVVVIDDVEQPSAN
jgi:uncharacterized protein (TIGR03435 family)